MRARTQASIRPARHGGLDNAEPPVRERVERLDFADRWLTDGFRVVQENPPGFLVSIDVEMTHARAAIDRLRTAGVRGSYAGVLARAAGLALARNRDLHTVLAGTRRMRPMKVRIGLSVANEAVAAPVLRLDAVEDKPLPLLCQEIAFRAPQAREEDSLTLARLRRWGWLVPFGWMRRLILRVAFSSPRFRHVFGALQVTVLPGADVVTSFAVGTTALLGMGNVTDRVVVRAGEPAVRLMGTLTCSGDHKVWDGARLIRVLGEVKGILESGELLNELPAGAANDVAG
jgi:pyruvate dehydrogenase E2 component (dihydrolipoamide acetyltransferase)